MSHTIQTQSGAKRRHPDLKVAPVFLSFVAGYVDSCMFLALSGLFVAQVTGSFVTAGSELVVHDAYYLIKVLAIPAFFAGGVVTTVLLTLAGEDKRGEVFSLALIALLLGAIIGVQHSSVSLGSPQSPATLVAAMLGIFAMGMQSASVRLVWRDYGSTNVMTTNTTQLAIDVTQMAITTFRHWEHPHDSMIAGQFANVCDRLMRLAPIMLGFLIGTVAGGLIFNVIGLVCLVLPIGILVVLAVRASRGWL
jgi:uncharacterized membrane protein YoaK (UPF0700 family)